MQEAVERQIEKYRKIIKSLEHDIKFTSSETIQDLQRGQIIVLEHVIRDLQNVIELFGEEKK